MVLLRTHGTQLLRRLSVIPLSGAGGAKYHEREVAVGDDDFEAVVSLNRQEKGPWIGPVGSNDAHDEVHLFVVMDITAHPQMTPLVRHLGRERQIMFTQYHSATPSLFEPREVSILQDLKSVNGGVYKIKNPMKG